MAIVKSFNGSDHEEGPQIPKMGHFYVWSLFLIISQVLRRINSWKLVIDLLNTLDGSYWTFGVHKSVKTKKQKKKG